MSVLIIDEETKKKIRWVMHYAEQHPFTLEDIELIRKGEKKAPGDVLGFRLFIPLYFRVVYSIVKSAEVTVKHISISVPTMGKMPNPVVVEEILKAFDFKKGIEPPNNVFLENERAVNVMEEIIKD